MVARSSVETEFRAIALGVCEVLWLQIILEDLKIQIQHSIEPLCDNQSTINIAHNPVQHDRTKHNEIDKHFITTKLKSKLLQTSYVSCNQQVVDRLTKGLAIKQFEELGGKLGMVDIHSPA